MYVLRVMSDKRLICYNPVNRDRNFYTFYRIFHSITVRIKSNANSRDGKNSVQTALLSYLGKFGFRCQIYFVRAFYVMKRTFCKCL